MYMAFVQPTAMQLIWSVFAVAVIVALFALHHLYLEEKHKKAKKRR